jgi:HSP20 family molecular chaperone IbpA
MFDWQNGYTITRRFSRSFATLEEAKRFAEGKPQADIYKSKGKYKVEWMKTESNN